MHRTSSDPESLVDENIDDNFFLVLFFLFQTCHNKTDSIACRFGRPSHHRGDEIPGLSRCNTFKLLAETYFNGSVTQASADVAPSNIKSRNLYENVETVLKMLLSSAILFWTLAMNHGRCVVPFYDWLT